MLHQGADVIVYGIAQSNFCIFDVRCWWTESRLLPSQLHVNLNLEAAMLTFVNNRRLGSGSSDVLARHKPNV